MDKIAVLIPCYNESKTIGKVVGDWKRVFLDAAVYVSDNNPNDGTDKTALEAGAIVNYEYQQGKGNVVRRMFRETDAECYVLVDGDNTYPAEFRQQMVKQILERKMDMVIGDRLLSTCAMQNKGRFHNFGNSLVKRTINRLFKCDIHDIMTGLRAFSSQSVKSFLVLSKGLETEAEMTIHAVDKNIAVENIIIEYRDRPEGSVPRLNTYYDDLKVLETIERLYKNYRPLEFFGTIVLGLFVLAGVMFFPVLCIYFEIGLVPKFPILTVSGFVALAVIVPFFAGVILSTIVEKERQEFEFRLNLIHMYLNRKEEL